jgi:formate hydrogenlyase subunit 4
LNRTGPSAANRWRRPFKASAREKKVPSGEFNYLAMVVGVFVIFALVLAYQSWNERS